MDFNEDFKFKFFIFSKIQLLALPLFSQIFRIKDWLQTLLQKHKNIPNGEILRTEVW